MATRLAPGLAIQARCRQVVAPFRRVLFIAVLDALAREGLAKGDRLPDETRKLYVSSRKALSDDNRPDLELSLAGIAPVRRAPLPAERFRPRASGAQNRSRSPR